MAAGVPTVWQMMLAHMEANQLRFSTMSRTVIGGSACPPAMIDAFNQRYGVEVLHAWGMTEMSPLGTVCTLKGSQTGLDAAALTPATTDELAAVVTGRLTFEGEGSSGGCTVEKVHFQSRPGLYVTANLYLPADASAEKPCPGVLYLCGHGRVVRSVGAVAGVGGARLGARPRVRQ